MSDGDKHILNVVKQVLNEELKSIVAIFQANQPTESGRMARLVSDTIETSLKPIKNHLSNQDIEIKAIKSAQEGMNTQIQTLSKQIRPVTTTTKWFSDTKAGTVWLAGFITPVLIIGAFIALIFKFIKNIKFL